jgi:galactose mutarotase-like enzyme
MNLYSQRYHGCRIDEFQWRGHRLIVLENELLRVSVLASKGADVLELRYKPRDLDLLWHAPQPVLPPGQEIPTRMRAQGSFLDFFPGAWVEVLPNAGPASVYKNAELGQHGEVALLPWDVRVLQDSESRVEVEFSVQTLRTPFQLVRRMSLQARSTTLVLDEKVSNLGEETMSYQWGHHPAFGEPFSKKDVCCTFRSVRL